MPAELHHPVFARLYAWSVRRESREQRAHRRELVPGLVGRVLEVGAGDGRNFALYGPDVNAVERCRRLGHAPANPQRPAPRTCPAWHAAVQTMDR